MITVKLNTTMNLKKIIGKREVEITVPNGLTIRDFIEEIVSIWGEELSRIILDTKDTGVLPNTRLMINGQDIEFLNGMDTELHEGDSVTILPFLIGG